MTSVSVPCHPDNNGYNMTIIPATPLNSSELAAARLARLADLLGHEPHKSALRALLAGDRSSLRTIVGEGKFFFEPLPESWWLEASEARPACILFTGFEPFGGHLTNPSWRVAQAAAARAARPGVTSHALRLPVTFDAAAARPASLIAEIPPTSAALLIHIGLAADRASICLERYAHNTCGRVADNAGAVGAGAPPYDTLDALGAAARETYLPLGHIAALMDAAGAPLPTEITRDPGTYVCNATYYAALGAVEARRAADGAADALFVHVPMLSDEQAQRVGEALGEALAGWLLGAGV